jgi:hypothetical protein
MLKSRTSEPDSDSVCACEQWMHSACTEELSDKEYKGKRYCVLHFPGNDKSASFKRILEEKRRKKDFNFRGAWFPDEVESSEFDLTEGADFRSATFCAYASFNSATFGAYADFRSATFRSDVSFRSATFCAAASFRATVFDSHTSFRSATFRAQAAFSLATFNSSVSFSSATFCADADFRSATFCSHGAFRSADFGSDASFSLATFGAAADFSLATFADHVKFAGGEKCQVFGDASWLDLNFAKIERLDHVSFHALRLRPYWFVNIDARKFDFTNVDWDLRSVSDEIIRVEENNVSKSHRLLATACQRLATNAEDNNRYEEASEFRYLAMDARRLERWRGFPFWRMSWWYWVASGYGERVFQAFVILIGIMVFFALLYTRVGLTRWEPKIVTESDVATAKWDNVGAPLKFSQALSYSAAVMTLQRPAPHPATTAAKTVVLLETMLGPVQAALLALAIRRKFMR